MYHVVSISQKGSKSSVNEDACIALSNKGIFVVADGVGGGPSGDFASRTLVEEVEHIFSSGDDPENDLLAAIQSANLKIYKAGQEPKLNGMATTVAAVVQNESTLLVCHVGDSRVYCLSDAGLEALTKDHSKLVNKGDDVQKQVVTNALGVRESVKVEVQRFPSAQGHHLLLMTDGISDVVSNERMQQLLAAENRSVSEKLKSLVDESERCGGRDDKTVLCVF